MTQLEAFSSSSEKSSMNGLCLAFRLALLLPIPGWTNIHSDTSFIQQTSPQGLLCLPLSLVLLETQLPLSYRKHFYDIRLPHNKLNVLSLMNITFH